MVSSCTQSPRVSPPFTLYIHRSCYTIDVHALVYTACPLQYLPRSLYRAINVSILYTYIYSWSNTLAFSLWLLLYLASSCRVFLHQPFALLLRIIAKSVSLLWISSLYLLTSSFPFLLAKASFSADSVFSCFTESRNLIPCLILCLPPFSSLSSSHPLHTDVTLFLL